MLEPAEFYIEYMAYEILKDAPMLLDNGTDIAMYATVVTHKRNKIVFWIRPNGPQATCTTTSRSTAARSRTWTYFLAAERYPCQGNSNTSPRILRFRLSKPVAPRPGAAAAPRSEARRPDPQCTPVAAGDRRPKALRFSPAPGPTDSGHAGWHS